MNLPIQFPKDEDVIREEAARFRAMSPEDRIRTIRGMINAGGMMASRSPKAEFMQLFTDEQERQTRQAVMDVIAQNTTTE